MDEIEPKAERVVSGRMVDYIPRLIFFLIAKNGERSYGRDELVIAKRVESGDGLECGAERKSHGVAQIGIAGFSEMQTAGVQRERTHPSWTEYERVADHPVQVVVVPCGAGGG